MQSPAFSCKINTYNKSHEFVFKGTRHFNYKQFALLKTFPIRKPRDLCG